MSGRTLTILWALLLLAPAATPQGKNKKRPPPDGPDLESVAREYGVGSIPLGATARGQIVMGFYNVISFEAVRGARVTFHLSTGHKEAQLLAELIGPRREERAKFAKHPETTRELVLEDYPLEQTGVYSIRFGFNSEHNGPYRLTSSATYPEFLNETLALEADGSASLVIDGMAGRRLKVLKVEPLDVKMKVDLSLVDPSGYEVDTSKNTQYRNFGRRAEVSGVTIESNGEFRLLLRETAGVGGRVEVSVEFRNPPLSRRTIRI